MLLLLRPNAGVSLGVSKTSRRVFLPVLLLLVTLSGCDDPSADEFVQRAETYRQEGNVSASIIELKNALQKESRHARARFLLGRSYLATRDFAGAEKEFLRARDYGFDAEQLADSLAAVWLNQRQFKKVLEQLQVRESASAASNAAVALARARAHRSLGQLEEAEQDFRSVLTHDPDSVAAVVGLGRIAMQRGGDLEVESAVARAIELAPNDLDVLALEGDYNFLRGDYAPAEGHYQAILKVRPDNIAVRLALARAQIFLGKPDQAVAHLDAVMRRARGHPDANYLRASLALQAKDFAAAKLHSEQVLFAYPHHVPSLLIAGAANYVLGQLEQADQYLARVLAEEPSHNLARRLHASTRARLERDASGRAALTPLLDDSLDARQLVAIADPAARERSDLEAGRMYLHELSDEYPGAVLTDPEPRTEGSDGARARLRADLEQTPNDVEVLLRLATLEARFGNPEESTSLLEQAMTAAPYEIAAHALLGQLYLRIGQPAKALDHTETTLRRHPEHQVLLGVVGLARLRLGRAAEAKLAFRSLVDLRPGSAAAHYLLALTYRDLSDTDRYKDRLEKALARDPDHLGARIGMGRILVQKGDLDAAKVLADRLREMAPNDSGVLAFSGAVALLRSRFKDAVALFKQLLAQEPTTIAALKLAFVQQRAGDGEGSRATLEHWLENALDDVDARLVLANKYLSMGSFDKARVHYAKIILLRPNNVVALNNFAWVGLRLGDPAAASYGERAFRLAPDDPRIMDTYGLLMLEAGKVDEAVYVLRRAAKVKPNSPETQTHLARALAKQGSDGEAREILRRVLSENVEFSERSDAEALLSDLGG